MLNPELSHSVENFCTLFVTISDDRLDHPWHWKGHDEGVRFASFLTLLELRTLAIKLVEERTKPQPVHQILNQYHAAYLDLQAALLGLSPEEADRAPSEKDWPVRRVLAHIVGAEIGFSAIVLFALEGHRAGKWTPTRMTDDDESRLADMTEAEYQTLMEGPYENLKAYHHNLHDKLLIEFAQISAEELDLPASFWEQDQFPIRYRLHRFEAHMRQHTIQIDKTLAAIGLVPTEARRLIRMLYSALAEVDGSLIGANETLKEERNELANALTARTAELKDILR